MCVCGVCVCPFVLPLQYQNCLGVVKHPSLPLVYGTIFHTICANVSLCATYSQASHHSNVALARILTFHKMGIIYFVRLPIHLLLRLLQNVFPVGSSKHFKIVLSKITNCTQIVFENISGRSFVYQFYTGKKSYIRVVAMSLCP